MRDGSRGTLHFNLFFEGTQEVTKGLRVFVVLIQPFYQDFNEISVFSEFFICLETVIFT